MSTKSELYEQGILLLSKFCMQNKIEMPMIELMQKEHKYYRVGSCAFYRFECNRGVIRIAIDKCANKGYGGPAWSWPGYVVDRTPFGVLQHELAHHVDQVKSDHTQLKMEDGLFSYKVYQASKESPMTGYLGTDKRLEIFYMEWFAEIMRLYITNYDLCLKLRPKFCKYMMEVIGIVSPQNKPWEERLKELGAPERTINQARKKIENVNSLSNN